MRDFEAAPRRGRRDDDINERREEKKRKRERARERYAEARREKLLLRGKKRKFLPKRRTYIRAASDPVCGSRVARTRPAVSVCECKRARSRARVDSGGGEEKGESERERERTRETFAASGLSARKRSGWRTRFHERKDADDVADGPSNKDNDDDLAGPRLSPAECAASRLTSSRRWHRRVCRRFQRRRRGEVSRSLLRYKDARIESPSGSSEGLTATVPLVR